MNQQANIHDPEAQTVLRWGITYATGLPLADVASVIQQEAVRQGFRITGVSQEEHTWVIYAVQTQPWYRILARVLPQRAAWVLQRQENRTLITSDTKFFPWYSAFVVGLCLLTWLLFTFAWNTARFGSIFTGGTDLRVGLPLLAGSALLLFVDFRFVSGGRRMTEWLHAFEEQIEQRGGFLDRTGSDMSRRYRFRVSAFLAFACCLALAVISPAQSLTSVAATPTAVAALVWILLVLVILVILALAAAYGPRGLSWRTLPALPGMGTIMAFLMFIAPVCLWLIVCDQVSDLAQVVHDAQTALQQQTAGAPQPLKPTPSLDPATYEKAVQAIRWLRSYARSLFLVSLAVIGLGLGFSLFAVRTALSCWPWVLRLQRNARVDYVRTTTAGRGFLTVYRSIVVVAWLLAGSFFLFGVGIVFTSLVFSLGGWHAADFPTMSRLCITEASVALLSVARGKPPADMRLVVLMGWGLYGLVCLTPYVFSLVQWMKARASAFERLRANATTPLAQRTDLQQVLHDLAERAGVASPVLSVPPDFRPYARSFRFGVFRGVSFIEVSSRCLRTLNSEELEALLAHELAHHVLHHCVRDNLLQFLGRLTVVGDGFTRALEDSFGYELEADRAAVVRLGADPAALKGCLETIQQDAATNEDTVAPLVAGLSALGIAPSHCAEILRQGPSSLSFWSRWRLAWRLYVDQFTGNMNTSYWHPAIEERIAALAMSSAPINGALPHAMKH